jgi:hypothetical protein
VARNLNPPGVRWLVASVFRWTGDLVLFVVAQTLFGRRVEIQGV